jgi:hypothetical protein
MSRREASVTQATIAKVLRAYLSQGFRVRLLIMRDGSTAFEPIEQSEKEAEVGSIALDREIIL